MTSLTATCLATLHTNAHSSHAQALPEVAMPI